MARTKNSVTAPKNSAEATLTNMARERLAALREKTKGNLGELGLFDFLVTASPELMRPHHLEAVVPYLEVVDKKPVLLAFSAPPRHGKSYLVHHLCARQMIRHPGIRIAYGCYGLDLAFEFSRCVKSILEGLNVEFDKNSNAKEEWRLKNDSSFKCVAPGSGFTGRGADLIIIDDPYKDRMAAESGAIRSRTWDWFTSVALTRRSPNASVILTHTRWCTEDLIGRVTKDHGWPYINMQAINPESGEALWPEGGWTLQKWNEVRPLQGEYNWASLYMGEPRPRGGAVFNDPHAYGGETLIGEGDNVESKPNPVQLPEKFKRITIGIDAAYTKKTHSDYSVAVVLGTDDSDRHFVLDVLRMQVEAPEFGKALKALRLKYGSPPIYWYIGGIEKAVADFFQNSLGVPVKTVPAKEDKFVRAQAAAAAWNAGKIFVPNSAKWLNAFLSEVLLFTGLDDPHDDQVDALAAAFIPSAGKRVVRGEMTKRLLSF